MVEFGAPGAEQLQREVDQYKEQVSTLQHKLDSVSKVSLSGLERSAAVSLKT